MADAMTATRPKTQVSVVYGQYHRFKLIPIMDHNADFFRAGPLTFGIEGRVLGRRDGTIGEIGASLHVFNHDRSEEWLRFDCFDRGPHYHYVHDHLGHNTVWGFDRESNGPLRDWALARIRTRLPEMLRKAGADALATQVEAQGGVDEAVLAQVEARMIEIDREIRPGSIEMIEEGIEWMRFQRSIHSMPSSIISIEEGIEWMDRWKRIHPQFNTVDEGEL